MTQVSARLASLSPSATLAMSQKSSELKAQGVDVINLSVGEPDFNTPEPIKDAAKKAIDENYSRYSPVAGYPALRNAIVAKLKNENGLEYTANQISCANGAKQSVCNTIMVLVNPGDEVIIPAPFWVSYPEMVKLAEGTPVIVAAGIEQDFKITPAQLEAAITPKTKALILCSPSNPTGSVYSAEELAGLAEVLKKHPEIIVIADEIYEHINYIGKHNSIAQVDGMKDRTVIVNGVSKAYAMTGWRIGFIAGPEWIVKAVNKLQGQYTSGPCSVSQKAAEAAYTGSQTPVEETMGALADIVRQGKALYVGISNYTAGQTEKALAVLKEHRVPCLIHQARYSMLDRRIEPDLLPLLKQEGVGMIAFSPLAQGMLTDKYLNGIPDNSRAAKSTGHLQREQVTEEKINKVRQLNDLAKQRGQTLAEMAIAWLLKDDRVTSVLVGASSVAQLIDNLKALQNTAFSAEEIQMIENILQ